MHFRSRVSLDIPVKTARAMCYLTMAIGAIFLLIGTYFISSAKSFASRSVETDLLVVVVESRMGETGRIYRPTFEAISPDGTVTTYSGNGWVSPKPHDQGDIVAGLVDWSNGKMVSVSMNEWSISFGTLFASIGGACFLLGLVSLWQSGRKTTNTYPL